MFLISWAYLWRGPVSGARPPAEGGGSMGRASPSRRVYTSPFVTNRFPAPLFCICIPPRPGAQLCPGAHLAPAWECVRVCTRV